MFTEHLLATRLRPGLCLQRVHHLTTEIRSWPRSPSWEESRVLAWADYQRMHYPGGSPGQPMPGIWKSSTHKTPQRTPVTAGSWRGWRGMRAKEEGRAQPVGAPCMCSWACTSPCKAIKELSTRAKVASCPFWSEHLDGWEEDEMKTRCSRNATVRRTTARRHGKMGELWDIQYWRRFKKKKKNSVEQWLKGQKEEMKLALKILTGIRCFIWMLIIHPESSHLIGSPLNPGWTLIMGLGIETQWHSSALGTRAYCRGPHENSESHMKDHLTSIYLPRQNSHKTSFLPKV